MFKIAARCLVLGIFLMIFGCRADVKTSPSSAPSPAPTAAQTDLERPNPYAPLAVGDYWKYSISTGGFMTKEVLEKLETPEGVLYKAVEIDPNYPIVSWYKFDSEGRLYRVKTSNSDDGTYHTFEPPYISTGLVEPGGSWSSRFKTVRHQPGAKSEEVVSETEFGTNVTEKETVVVPAGTFETYRLDSSDLKDREWVAKGVGMVKFEGKLQNELIVYELVEYRVP